MSRRFPRGPQPRQVRRARVPDVHEAVAVDPKNRRVRRFDESRVLLLLRDARGNVLADAHDANHPVLLVASGRGVQQNLHARAVLRDEGKLEVRRLDAHERLREDVLHAYFIVVRDEAAHEVRALRWGWVSHQNISQRTDAARAP